MLKRWEHCWKKCVDLQRNFCRNLQIKKNSVVTTNCSACVVEKLPGNVLSESRHYAFHFPFVLIKWRYIKFNCLKHYSIRAVNLIIQIVPI